MKRVTIYGWISAAVALAVAVGVGTAWLLQPPPRKLTQADIDSAVLHTLTTKTLPSRTARAAEAVRESVVEIRNFQPAEKKEDASPSTQAGRDPPGRKGAKSAPPSPPARRDELARNNAPDNKEQPARAGEKQADRLLPDKPADRRADKGRDKVGDKPSDKAGDKSAGAGDTLAEQLEPHQIGSGVVVTETGIVLTNYHVVAGAKRIEIRFHNGFIAEGVVRQAMPEKDLAIVQARTIPDDLPAATLGNSRELAPGSEVVAVGFPFGIGPSVSAGVVSGLDREFVSPDNKHHLEKLIQFDAAANPGNSGGPLVNMNGEVVGIVTAILNPNNSGTFLGIGFAITIESAGGSLGLSPF